jgi:DNA-directed RNA polymerase subunit RPC12/RpoP
MAPVEPPAAPPEPGPDDVTPPRCPWCGSDRVERISLVGPQLMSEQYVCLNCHSPFERIRR